MPVLQSGASQLGRAAYFCVGEAECKVEIVVGQFNIFGATEEIHGHGSSRIDTDQERD